MVANTDPTTFTDDKLADYSILAEQSAYPAIAVSKGDLKSLITRLKAAERIASYGHVDWCDQSDKACECGYKEWQKASGKDQ